MSGQHELEWVKGSTRYYITTACGRYNVCKTGAGEWLRYTAWRMEGRLILGVTGSADEAKALCSADAQR